MNLLFERLGRPACYIARVACATVLLGSISQAQETCGVEVKLLLQPSQTKAASTALKAKKGKVSHIYFFDTASLELLSQGVVVRLRQGANAEITVKVRHPEGKVFADPSGGRDRFKCEVDFIGGQGQPSYSLESSYAETQIPETGEDLYRSLSAAQKELLKESQLQVDWSRVKRIADIESTAWKTKPMPGLGKLSLELWQFSAGQILELSTKGPPDTGKTGSAALLKLAESKGLSSNLSQLPKTTTVLEALGHIKAH